MSVASQQGAVASLSMVLCPTVCCVGVGLIARGTRVFTPQSGLLQGTRVGDMDVFALPYIMKKKGITLEKALAANTMRSTPASAARNASRSPSSPFARSTPDAS